MRNFPQRLAKNGSAGATLVIGAGGRPTIRISLIGRRAPSATLGFSLGQAEAVVDALAGAIADSHKRVEIGRFEKHVARNGRAHASLHRAYEGTVVWLTVSLGTDRYINLPLDLPQAEGVFSSVAGALRDAQAHRAGEGAQ